VKQQRGEPTRAQALLSAGLSAGLFGLTPATPPQSQLVRRVPCRRFASLDFYGLAAGLAASWAVLVASKSAVLEKDMAYDMLYNCAYLIQKVRLRAHALAHSALHRLLLNRLRAVQAVGRWGSVSESDVWGQAATAAVLTQFYPRLATVLVWLANAAEPRVPRQFIPAGQEHRAHEKSLYRICCLVRTAPHPRLLQPLRPACRGRVTLLWPAAAPD